jgi:phosphatidylglycerophosphatase A
MKDCWVRLIATVGYSGQIPGAPGTWGSLVGLLLFLCALPSLLLQAVLFFVLTAAGIWAGTQAERLYDRKDPPSVVIDEACGVFLVFAGFSLSPGVLVAGFVIYRALDIFKPFPMRRLERWPGGWGIMADDLWGGVYTRLALWALLRLNLLH